MEFSFTTLGTASALPIAHKYPSAHVLNIRERLFLIDCGEGAQMQMRKYDVQLSRIDNIFISHLHGDHIFGLMGLLSTFGMMNRLAPLYIYAPESMSGYLNYFKANFAEGVKYDIVFEPVKCSEPVMIYESHNLEIYAFPLKHRGETYGYLFREKQPMANVRKELIEKYNLSLTEIGALKRGENIVRNRSEYAFGTDSVSKLGSVSDSSQCGCKTGGEIEQGKIILKNSDFTYIPYKPRSFAYCSDTAPFKKLPEWVKGVDLLYHEATFASDLAEMAKATFHSTAEQAAECAVASGAGKLIIGHYSSRYRNRTIFVKEARKIFSNTFSAKEGTKFEIPLEKYNKDESYIK